MIANCPACRAPVTVSPGDVGAPAQCLACHRPFLVGHDPREEASRRRNLAILGVVLLAAFLAPYPLPDGSRGGFQLGNFSRECLHRGAPLAIVILVYSPALLGICVLVGAFFPTYPFRGVAMCLLPAIPIAAILTLTVQALRHAPFDSSVLPYLARAACAALVGLAVLLLLLVGTRLRPYRPWNRTGYLLGCAGAAICLIQMLLAVCTMILPRHMSSLAPYGGPAMGIGLLFHHDPHWTGFISLAATLAMLPAAVLCFINRPAGDQRPIRRRAATAFWLIVSAQVFTAASVVILIGHTIDVFDALDGHGLILVAAVIASGKMMLMSLLLPIGILDLLLGPPAAQPVPPRPADNVGQVLSALPGQPTPPPLPPPQFDGPASPPPA